MAEGVEIPVDQLNPDTLDGLVQSFVLREGTDYGLEEAVFATKVEQVKRQLRRGDVLIVFDPEEETCSIVPKDYRRK